MVASAVSSHGKFGMRAPGRPNSLFHLRPNPVLAPLMKHEPRHHSARRCWRHRSTDAYRRKTPELAGPPHAASQLCLRGDARPELLCEPDEKAFGAADVAQPIGLFVLNHFADELRAMLAEPGERLVEVVHSEHHT